MAVDALLVETSQVRPLVIGETVCGYGQPGLDTVEQTLHKDGVSRLLPTIKHQLEVRRLARLPVLVAVLHLVGVLGVKVGTVDAHQHGKRAKAGVVAEAQVGDMVAAPLDDGIGLRDDVFQDGNHLVSGQEHPGVGAKVRLLPPRSHLVVGNQTAHHALMPYAGQRGVEIDEVVSDALKVARQTVGAGEHPLHHLVAQRFVKLEPVLVALPAGRVSAELALQRVLVVGGHHAVERLACRLLTHFNLRVTLHQLLAEGRHAEHAAPRERGDGQHVAATPEHLGEVVVHRSGNALVLLPPQVAQLAHTRRQLVLRSHELLEECLALGGQQMLLVM